MKHLPVVDGGGYCGLVGVADLAPYVVRRRLDIDWHGDSFVAPEGAKPQAQQIESD